MSNLSLRTITGKDGLPVLFPTGIAIGSGALGGVNNIGIAGQPGFGVGICPGPMPSGMVGMSDYQNPMSDNYGNYQYTDGSVMVWIPAFYYLWGADNSCSIRPFSYYSDVATAAADGYALHRAFYDGGAVQPGFFIDKYLWSNNGGIASSLKNGIPLSSAVRGSLASAHFSHCTGNGQSPADTLGGAIAVAKSRGNNFFCSTRFNFAALAMLSYAHGKASTATTYCAWYTATGVSAPRGCNNDALRDYNDTSVLYVSDGNGTYNCGKTGSANLFSRTTHNGQNCGVADLNGLLWEVTPGLTVHVGTGGTYANGESYLGTLKTSKAIKSLTGSNSGATDMWGVAGFTENYEVLGYYSANAPFGALHGDNAAVKFGKYVAPTTYQVFSAATSGAATWGLTGLGIPQHDGTSAGGTNPFGSDGFWDYKPNEMCPISGGYWGLAANAGVWALFLADGSAASGDYYGGRAALLVV